MARLSEAAVLSAVRATRMLTMMIIQDHLTWYGYAHFITQGGMPMNSEKTCSKCGESKPLSAFYAQMRRKDGRMSHCKECHKEGVRKNEAIPEEIRKAKRAQRKEKARVQKLKRYQHLKIRRSHPLKFRAILALGEAIKSGEVRTKPCEICGALKVKPHHDDYSKPLEVRWFCAHHLKHHARQGSEKG